MGNTRRVETMTRTEVVNTVQQNSDTRTTGSGHRNNHNQDAERILSVDSSSTGTGLNGNQIHHAEEIISKENSSSSQELSSDQNNADRIFEPDRFVINTIFTLLTQDMEPGQSRPRRRSMIDISSFRWSQLRGVCADEENSMDHDANSV